MRLSGFCSSNRCVEQRIREKMTLFVVDFGVLSYKMRQLFPLFVVECAV